MSVLHSSGHLLRQYWRQITHLVPQQTSLWTVWVNVCISIITAGGLFVWQAPKSLNIQDEGYLWYGTRQVLNGFVPIRDFEAYDPLRYYFGALIQYIVTDTGIWSIRLATTIISAACLLLILLVISRNVTHQFTWVSIFIVAITSLFWIYPSHKVYDIFASLLLLSILGAWIKNPTPTFAYYVGVIAGIIILINRNHGLYAGIGTLCVLFWLSRNQQMSGRILLTHIGLLIAGGLTGLLPFIGMLLFIPGFADAYFYYQVLYFYNLKVTNLALPVPWPWRITMQGRPFSAILYDFVTGIYFLYVVLAGVVSWGTLAWWWYKKQTHQINAYLVASMVLIPVYAHHIFSRADIAHLSQGFMPVLITTIIALRMQASTVRYILLLGFLGLSTYLMLPQQPGYQCSVNTCPIITVQNQQYQGNKRITSTVKNIIQVIEKYNATDSFVIAPYAPGIYALLDSTSPFYFSYNVYAQSIAEEQDQITQLINKKITLVLIDQSRVDGRKDLGFAKTSPLTYAYIKSHYTFVGVTERYEVYQRNP
jgi:hypothetical protein